MRRLRNALTYANVMSTIAVFLALGGTAFAAVKLGVGQVKSKNIASNAVTSSKVRDKSIRLADLSPEIASAKGVLGPAGKDGKDGAPGAAGVPGAAGRDGAAVGDFVTFTTPPLVRRTITATPPVLLFQHSWTQPPNSYDEISGFATINWPTLCVASGGVEAQVAIVVDDQLVSFSTNAGSTPGNPTVAGVPSYLQLSTMAVTDPGAASTPTQDFANLPFERAQYLTGAAAETHTLRLYGRSTCSGVAEPTLSGTLVVRRFARQQ